ncbi:MAG: zinc-ribbon domain-containing protein [Gammaproteobacteria bacterium]
MFCLQCGAKLPEGAHFCSECGMAVNASGESNTELASSIQKEHNAKHHPALIVKPRMVTWVVLARYLPLQINLTIIGAIIFGLIAVGYHLWEGNLHHPVRPFIFFAIFFFIFFPIVIYAIYNKTNKAARYEFYHDRVECFDGFWNIQHNVIFYKHVTEISLRRNILQRLSSIGTIHFVISSVDPKHRGLFITDVEHPATVYQQIEQLMRS